MKNLDLKSFLNLKVVNFKEILEILDYSKLIEQMWLFSTLWCGIEQRKGMNYFMFSCNMDPFYSTKTLCNATILYRLISDRAEAELCIDKIWSGFVFL